MTESQISLIYIELGKRIRKARKRANLNQEKVAEVLNLSRSSIVNIEAGRQRPPIHLLYTFAQLLEVKVSDLMADAMPEESGGLLPESIREELRNSSSGDSTMEIDLEKFLTQIFKDNVK